MEDSSKIRLEVCLEADSNRKAIFSELGPVLNALRLLVFHVLCRFGSPSRLVVQALCLDKDRAYKIHPGMNGRMMTASITLSLLLRIPDRNCLTEE